MIVKMEKGEKCDFQNLKQRHQIHESEKDTTKHQIWLVQKIFMHTIFWYNY